MIFPIKQGLPSLFKRDGVFCVSWNRWMIGTMLSRSSVSIAAWRSPSVRLLGQPLLAARIVRCGSNRKNRLVARERRISRLVSRMAQVYRSGQFAHDWRTICLLPGFFRFGIPDGLSFGGEPTWHQSQSTACLSSQKNQTAAVGKRVSRRVPFGNARQSGILSVFVWHAFWGFGARAWKRMFKSGEGYGGDRRSFRAGETEPSVPGGVLTVFCVFTRMRSSQFVLYLGLIL